MSRLREIRKGAARVLVMLTLGAMTTFTVSAALGAWLPHQGLWCVKEFADVAPRDDIPRDLVGISISKFGRAGMERRSWYPLIPGLDIMATRLTWDWEMGSDTVKRTFPVRFEADASGEWGALGEAARGERDVEIMAADDARGWPLLAFWCEINEKQGWRGNCTVSGGFQLPTTSSSVGSIRCIPYRPIWSGLAVNTLVYAVIWAAAYFCLPVTRRRHRCSRGCCPNCGYDLQHELAGGCPECGWNKDPKVPA